MMSYNQKFAEPKSGVGAPIAAYSGLGGLAALTIWPVAEATQETVQDLTSPDISGWIMVILRFVLLGLGIWGTENARKKAL